VFAEMATSFSELELLKDSWDRLAMARPAPEVFHTFAWARAWWEGYSREYEVFSPVVRDASGQVVAIWPLVHRDGEIRALGEGASDHNDLLVSPENASSALQAALDLLLENCTAWNAGIIRHVSERGLLLKAAGIVTGAARASLEIAGGRRGWATVAEVGAAHFQHLARKESLRRHRKKLERLGPVTFRHIEDREEIKGHLDTFQRQHIERWALLGIRSRFFEASSKRYYAGLVDHLSPLGPLRFAVLEVGGRPAAYHLGFESAGRYVWYKPTFDVDLWDSGPGEVLLQSVLQYCASAGITELDFTIGDDPYKSRFSNVTYGYFQIHLFSHRSASQYILHAREQLRRSPRFYRWANPHWVRGRGWFQRLRNVLKRDGLTGFAGERVRRLVRACMFRRDEVSVFRLTQQGKVRHDRATPDVEVLPLRFSLLAEAALRYPDRFGPNHLRTFKERIAAGDRGVVALYRGGVAQVAWVGKRSAIVATETGPRCALPLSREADAIYDCWTPPECGDSGAHLAVLQWLVQEELHSGREMWTYCLREDSASRTAILKAGFTEAARLVRTRWFGCLEKCRAIQTGET